MTGTATGYKEWGKRGTAPGEFHTLHSIATDAKGNVYVGDRENNRIQVFDGEGNFLKEWSTVGAPWAICITPGPKQVLYASDSLAGRIYKLDLDGNILGEFGKDGKRLAGVYCESSSRSPSSAAKSFPTE